MSYKTKKKSSKPVESPDSNQGDELFRYVSEKYDDAKSGRETWINKQVKYNKLRMRIKKAKTFPFVGCSNIRMPTAEIKIRKVKAALYNVIFGTRPIVQAVPPPSGRYEMALKIEKFLDHLLMERMKIQNKAIIAIDQELEQGFFLLKPYWCLEITTRKETYNLKDFSLEEVYFLYDSRTTQAMIKEFLVQEFDVDLSEKVRKDNENALDEAAKKIDFGETDFEFSVQDVIKDIPEVALVSPEKCFVPSNTGYDPQSSECIIHEDYYPYHVLQTNAEHFGWDIKGVEEIGDYKGNNQDTQNMKESNRDLQEGIDSLNSPNHLVRVWEYCGWYDINDDGVKEKCMAYFAPDFNKTLKKMTLPLLSGKFPFVKLFYELTSDRWYAHRGMVEIAEDIIKEIDIQHNMKIDQQTIRNAPMFLYRAGMVNPNLIQLIPNQAIPIKGMGPLRDNVDVLNNTNPNAEFSYEREQQILESKLEELFGQTDFTLQSMINKRQPRTLGEVELQQQNMQQVFALDAGMHTEQFTELVNHVWDLWCQYGPDEYEFNYFGQQGWEKIKMSKEEIQGKYKVSIRGNDRNTNPNVRIQKAQQILLATQNPVLIQAGVITPPQMIAGLKRFYQYLEVDNWEELINLQWQPPPPPSPAQIVPPEFDELVDGEQAQVLASVGIQPDVQGRMMRKQMELNESMGEHSRGSQPKNSKS